MKHIPKRLVAKLPGRLQQSLKRRLFANQIARDRFSPDEPEVDLVEEVLRAGDWVVDVGANIGHYTLLFSRLVGERGRVIAFEPVPETFELLASNASYSGRRNITLINAAASDSASLVGMDIPAFDTGLKNFYQAQISSTDSERDLSVLCLRVDSLDLPETVSLVKVDAEGHELFALRGMESLLRRDRPVLVVERGSDDVVEFLAQFGYSMRRLPHSPNAIFEVPSG